MITGVIYKSTAHDTIQIVLVLVVNSNSGIILELLSDRPLEKIHIELRKEERIQGSLALLDGIQV
jgi:hypothetical protein